MSYDRTIVISLGFPHFNINNNIDIAVLEFFTMYFRVCKFLRKYIVKTYKKLNTS